MKRMVVVKLTRDAKVNRSLMPQEMIDTIETLQAFGKVRLTKFEVEQGSDLAIKIEAATREYEAKNKVV
tara:strand:- start:1303 stop:1509 length:207 start_codon:yes stop_codon:yes gene_type:complete